MEMIGHQAVGAEPDPAMAIHRLGQHLLECLVIGLVLEEFDALPGAVHDVVRQATGGKARFASHGAEGSMRLCEKKGL
jgi:hypothetical protein